MSQQSEINRTKPAFPVAGVTSDGSGSGWSEEGMTLRDYFAAKAMAKMCQQNWRVFESIEGEMDSVAEYAYRMADAMMKAR